MGQNDVLKALTEIGRPSTVTEIAEHMTGNRNESDIKHIRSSLDKLFKWDEVAFVPQTFPRKWYVTEYGMKCNLDHEMYDITHGW